MYSVAEEKAKEQQEQELQAANDTFFHESGKQLRVKRRVAYVDHIQWSDGE